MSASIESEIKFCRDFSKGLCKRKKCKYSHVLPVDGKRPVCQGEDQPVIQAGVDSTATVNPGVQSHTVASTITPVRQHVKQGDVNFRDFSYTLAELPTKISASDVGLKVCTEFAKLHNITIMTSEHLPSSVSYHPIDGKVIRDVATKKGLSAGIRFVASHYELRGPMRIIDLWGNNRTGSYLKEAANKTRRYDEAMKLFDFKVVSQIHDNKDLLRNHNYSMFETINMSEVVGAHVVLIQDVQQKSTSKYNLLQLAIKVNCVVWIGHIEQGPMGFNGAHGFFVKTDDHILNWASVKDAPYVDTEDMEWLLERNCEVVDGVTVSWCVQPIYGNTVFVLFTRVYRELDSHAIIKSPDFVVKDLEVTNPTLYRLRSIPCVTTCFKWMTKDSYDDCLGKIIGSHERGIVYMPFANLGASLLKGKTFGIGTDKQLDMYMEKLFSEEERFMILKNHDGKLYSEVEEFTTAYARRLEAKRVYNVSRLGASSIQTIKQANKWRTADDKDDGFNRCGCCLYTFSCLALCSFFVLGNTPTILFTCCKPIVSLNDKNLPLMDMPADFESSVVERSDINTTCRRGVFNYGIRSYPKRFETSAVLPAEPRLGRDGHFGTFKGKTIYYKGILDDTEFTEIIKDQRTYHYGPNYFPWHANKNSPGHAKGVMCRLMSPVVLPDGEVLSVEDSAIRGQLLAGCSYMRVPQFVEPITVEMDDRLHWCQNHVKSAVYMPAFAKLSRTGEQPYTLKGKIIPKTNELMIKDKERVLVGCEPEVAAWYGVVAERLHERIASEYDIERFDEPVMMRNGITAHFTWGSGTNPISRGKWMECAETISLNHIAVTACGDDCAAIVNIGGLVLGVESDAKDWDHTQILYTMEDETKQGMLNVEHKYFSDFGAPQDYQKSLLEAQCVEWKAAYGAKEGYRVNLGYSRRWSGFLDTTDGNTLNMGHMMCNILCDLVHYCLINEVDTDAIPEYVKKFVTDEGAKYGVHLKVKVHDNYLRMTFLRGFYVPCRINLSPGYCWYPSPEILMKIGTSQDDPAKSKEYRDLVKLHPNVPNLAYHMRAYDIVNSWKTFTGLPVLDVYQKIIKSPIYTTYEDSRRRSRNLEKYDKPELNGAIITGQEWDYMLTELGIKEQLESFRQMTQFVNWSPGVYISHPIITQLAVRYG